MKDPLSTDEKLCVVCHKGPREVPDRNSTSSKKAVCRPCHGKRLQQDLREIMALENRRRG